MHPTSRFALIVLLIFASIRTLGASGATDTHQVTLSNSTPVISGTALNHGNPITLTAGATTTVDVNFTVSDNNGCGQVFFNGTATVAVYRSGVTASCVRNALNCYTATVVSHACPNATTTQVSAAATATVDIWYFADATDASSSYAAQNWATNFFVSDGAINTGSGGAAVELNSLLAVGAATGTLSYGTVSPGATTTGNLPVTLVNTGNTSSTFQVSGSALTFGSRSISTSSQHYATSTFTYGGAEQVLSGTAQAISGFLANKGPMTSSWTFAGTTMYPIHQHLSLAHNRYLYYIGGRDDGFVSHSEVSRIALGANGALGSQTSSSLPNTLYNHSGAVIGDYFYTTGGEIVGVPTSTVLFSSVASDGSLGGWSTTAALPSPIYRHGTAAYGGYIYNVGGLTSGVVATSTVNFAPVNATGSLSPWTGTASLPNGLYGHSVAANNGFLYALGGRDQNDILTSTVRFARMNATGSIGVWTNTSALPNSVDAAAAVFDGGILYVTGGYAGQTTSSVYFAVAGSDGNLSPWSLGTALPSAIDSHGLVADNGYLYTVGGASAVTSTINMISAATRNTYWGVQIPGGTATGTFSGTDTFTAVFSP